jgi:DNA-3-methyladenine glycosylase I
VPQYDSRTLWETLMLEGFQAGLSWLVILRKRDAFRAAFQNFDPAAVARFGEADVARLMEDSGIVRSRAKIEATIGGARIYLAMAAAEENFSKFAWNMAGERPEQVSKELKKRGFKFVGPVIVYAWMQAVGLVNGHAGDCFRRGSVSKMKSVKV